MVRPHGKRTVSTKSIFRFKMVNEKQQHRNQHKRWLPIGEIDRQDREQMIVNPSLLLLRQ